MTSRLTSLARPGGPFFDDLAVGERVTSAPAVTLTSGMAAVHQSILGDRLRLPLDAVLSAKVTGATHGQPVAHPALVWDTAIGQSTLATQRVIANLFYRGLVLRRMPFIGDTLTTSTEVVALRQNRPRAGRAATGLAGLRVVTVDQHERPVLDFVRCAMLPLSDPDGTTACCDDLDSIPAALDPTALVDAVRGWELSVLVPQPASEPEPGIRFDVPGRDVVSSAPELARLTLNVATAHHDATTPAGRRLVYGGHTIGLALSQVSRALPALVTVLAWHGCDHVGPVFEGDTLESDIEIERCEQGEGPGRLIHLRVRVRARRPTRADVLDWRFVALCA